MVPQTLCGSQTLCVCGSPDFMWFPRLYVYAVPQNLLWFPTLCMVPQTLLWFSVYVDSVSPYISFCSYSFDGRHRWTTVSQRHGEGGGIWDVGHQARRVWNPLAEKQVHYIYHNTWSYIHVHSNRTHIQKRYTILISVCTCRVYFRKSDKGGEPHIREILGGGVT